MNYSRSRTTNNDVKSLVKEFAKSSIDCVCVDHSGYKRPVGLCYTLSSSIKRCGLSNSIEAHCKGNKVYMVKSNKIDRNTLRNKKKEIR